MKIGFIGAGRVGTAIGIYLFKKNITISGYYSKSFSSAKKAAALTNSTPFENLDVLIKQCDVIAITTPDDEITNIVVEIKKLNCNLQYKIIFHMSGVHSSKIFKPLKDNDLTTLSIHPMLSISDSISAAKEVENAVFTIEGEGEQYNTTKLFIDNLGIKSVTLSTDNKIMYHAACSLISNYLVTLINTGRHMLISSGFPKELATESIKPLFLKTVNNILENGTENSLTGPIARGDTGTIQKHLAELINYPEWFELYNVLALNTVNFAKNENYINNEKATELKEVLFKND